MPTRWTRPPELGDVRRVWFKEFPTLGDNMAVAVAAREVHRALAGDLDRIDDTQGWARVRRRGEQLCRAAADAPATVFFRDRAAALAALARLDVDETTVAGFLFG